MIHFDVTKYYKKWSTPKFVLLIIALIIVMAIVSFLAFTFGYWLITLILAGFFNFILPFSWWYSLGAWLICLIIGIFIKGVNLEYE